MEKLFYKTKIDKKKGLNLILLYKKRENLYKVE